MGPDTQRLTAVLQELIELLRATDQAHWADWVAESRRRLLGSDGSGILHLLGAYGGMGSFNDICFQGPDGRRLEALRSEAWRLADSIRTEAGLD